MECLGLNVKIKNSRLEKVWNFYYYKNIMMKEEEIKNQNKEKNIENEDVLDDVEFIDSTEDGEPLPSKDIVKRLREENKKLRNERDEYLTGWQRAKADYVNLQKEHGDSHIRSSILTKEKFMNDLLPALDSFDMAFSNKENWEKVDKNWRMGVEYIYTQFMKGLEDAGVEKIDRVGIPFDPSIHESIEIIDTKDKKSDHNIAKIVHRIIRPAKVNIFEFKTE